MAVFRSRIVGAERIHSLTALEDRVVSRLRVVIEAKAQEVLASARSKVSGDVLNVQEGKLLKSLRVKMVDGKYGPYAKVFSAWYIARFFERGYGGKSVQVKSYQRAVSVRTRVEKVKESKRRTRIKFVREVLTSTTVKAHSRRLPHIERGFLRASLDEHRSSIRAALNAAVKEA